jgi:2,5-diketo-D-gluconate reductase A
VNQIELHPRLPQVALRRENALRGIATQSWSPLANGGDVLTSAVTAEIGARCRRSAAQVVLRWHVQQGLIAIPKASSADRLRENLAVFDFGLTTEDMAAIDALAVGAPAVGTEDPRTHEEF